MTRRTSVVLRALSCLLIAGELALIMILHRRFETADTQVPPLAETAVSAVPELSRQRHLMRRAERALRDADGTVALELLQSASFEGRAIETYRRYYLANAYELLGRREEARAVLARLWSDEVSFVKRIDVAFHLADLFERDADWRGSADVLETLALADSSRAVSQAAYQQVRASLVALGDVSGLIGVARSVAVHRAGTPAGALATADLERLGVGLTRAERIERAGRLARDGDVTAAFAEIERLRKNGSTLKLEQARAEVLARQGKREEADRIVLTFVGRNETLDRSLISSSWGWWAKSAGAIEDRAWRNVRVRRRSGTERVKVGGKWVTRPVYTTVTRRVKRALGRADRRRLVEVNRILIDRGERLLELGVDAEHAREIHRRLARAEVSPRRQEKMEAHIRGLVEIDPASDELLQLMWDEGWGAWRKRDLDTARERFAFIHRVYRLPNIRRQAQYWYARCLEESGETVEASRNFRELQNAPYDDVYALLARARTEGDGEFERPSFIPFERRPDDWVRTAERDMPGELRLAWELSLLGLDHDARMEVRANTNGANRQWAYSILARIHRAEGSPLLVGHTLRVAWPEIGTVEQDRVPVHFLRMYYPTRHHDIIDREAAKQNLDPALVKGLVLQESAYDPSARSGAGATGLMQLMAATARETAPRVDLEWDEGALTDPAYNIAIGTRYLRTLLAEFDDNPVLALASYNGGVGNVRRWLRRDLKGRAPDEVLESIPFSETRWYVKRVVLYRSVYDLVERARTPR
jgi:soluble lytic murein transglycosylase-like protein